MNHTPFINLQPGDEVYGIEPITRKFVIAKFVEMSGSDSEWKRVVINYNGKELYSNYLSDKEQHNEYYSYFKEEYHYDDPAIIFHTTICSLRDSIKNDIVTLKSQLYDDEANLKEIIKYIHKLYDIE